MWQKVKDYPVSGIPVSFLDSVKIWIKKPHVINRRLCGAKLIWTGNFGEKGLDCEEVEVDQDETVSAAAHEINGEHSSVITSLIQNHFPQESDESHTLTVTVRDMIPKCIDKFPVLKEAVVVDEVNQQVTFFLLHPPVSESSCSNVKQTMGYKIQSDSEGKCLTLYVIGDPERYNVDSGLGYTLPWLQDTLMPKLSRWSTEKQLNTDITSLRLVAVDRYNVLYQELKKKYGLPLVEKWPERTDPQKFVYEDVAIAAYLLLLWEDDRQKKGLTKKQSFVDLGCGNGLLVYILESEGHKGLGLDLRKRKIWDLYDRELNLVESVITPSDENRYPEYDWLIGNHSDELTPWIPVMAARSCYECCFFVLPCCPWDFTAKFSQKSSGVSQYRGYLNFVQEVGQTCGFDVEEDTLRIPSTKRVCFIGRTRTYARPDEPSVNARIDDLLCSRCNTANNSGPMSEKDNVPGDQLKDNLAPDSTHSHEEQDLSDVALNSTNHNEHQCTSDVQITLKRKWASDFKARSSTETSRNCLTVDTAVKDRITRVVFTELLKVDDSSKLSDSAPWYPGVALDLSDVAALFDKDTLQTLKNECGGLQTLLRNSHHIFRVQGGKVTLRNWTTDDYDQHQQQKRRRKGKISKTERTVKTKLCYFHDNHPQGCPMSSELCRFAHGEKDLLTCLSNSKQSSEPAS